MKFYSPLRYPGGKNKLSKFIALICEKNNINGHYVEPYAGGASVALYLLINNYVKEITINDADRAIYAFWYSILHNTKRFCKKIEETKVDLKTWRKYREIYENKDKEKLFDLGFATFFLNRTNRSGIIDGGMIGGLSQEGEYKIGCRFYKDELIGRIKLIAKHKKHIHLYHLDALDLISEIEEQNNDNTIFYFDPPYYLHGPSLYMNHYKHENHEKVSKKIRQIKNIKWIVSYDNTKEIKKIYPKVRRKEYSFLHRAYGVREGKEVLFFSSGLKIPRIADPTKVK